MSVKLHFERHFTKALKGVHPFDDVEWEIRTAEILDAKGGVVFRQEGVEIPKFWSVTAGNIVTSKYFHGPLGSSERENSVKQLISRVTTTLREYGQQEGYFNEENGVIFEEELAYLLVHQMAAFNSPVWFNIGVKNTKKQASACFILKLDDDIDDIYDRITTEARLFKRGSGSGINFSRLREDGAPLSGGGSASGPMSFMKAFDASAGIIKSGGTTRRAALMRLLDVDHPDILEFIKAKAKEEKKAQALIREGYDSSYTGEAYASVFYQNSNNSVRVTDEFMRAVEEDGDWNLISRHDGRVTATLKARDIFKQIAQAAWECGDPGLQFDTTINSWHTSPNSGRIEASNPCSEFVFLNETSCNLSSFNLLRFYSPEEGFKIADFEQANRIMITAMELLVGYAEYPTQSITEKTKAFRPLGIGYANLGGLLMAMGLAYGSKRGQAEAAVITAMMSGICYEQSALMAQVKGAFAGYQENKGEMEAVIARHAGALGGVKAEELSSPEMLRAAEVAWAEAMELGRRFGFRNAQISTLAPTGTISFLMDADTTGLEPEIALVRYKKLVGEGLLKLVNQTVPMALRKLGYTDKQTDQILAYIDQNDTIEGAPGLKEEHLEVFDCSFKPLNGRRSLDWKAHVEMMEAVQPFVSGAISKTCNLPETVTVEEIENIYLQAWKKGLKAIAIYRDGCKVSQPLSTSRAQATGSEEEAKTPVLPVRRRLPKNRRAVTHKFEIAGHEGYLIVGLYEDNTPGEIFLLVSKAGSTLEGFCNTLSVSLSLNLQYGVPVSTIVSKLAHVSFPPAGFTDDPDIHSAKSIPDYIAKFLANNFLSNEEREAIGLHGEGRSAIKVLELAVSEGVEIGAEIPAAAQLLRDSQVEIEGIGGGDGEFCSYCGGLMQRSGSCMVCPNCGITTGCG